MEVTLNKASRILAWIGVCFLGGMLLAMIVMGFISGMVAVAVLAVVNGGDPSPIFFILKGVQFMWQFAMIMFLFASLTWALALLARHRKKQWEERREEYFAEMKEGIMEALEEAPEFKLKKSRRHR